MTLLRYAAARRIASRLARLGVARARIENALDRELADAVARREIEQLIASVPGIAASARRRRS
jgi:ribosomal protein L19E